MLSPLPWFGPRGGAAWGWTPLTWEGGVIVLACFIAILAAAVLYGRTRRTWIVTAASLALLLTACVLTGTAPG